MSPRSSARRRASIEFGMMIVVCGRISSRIALIISSLVSSSPRLVGERGEDRQRVTPRRRERQNVGLHSAAARRIGRGEGQG